MSANSGVEQGRNAQQEALNRAPPATPHSQSFAVLAVAVLGNDESGDADASSRSTEAGDEPSSGQEATRPGALSRSR